MQPARVRALRAACNPSDGDDQCRSGAVAVASRRGLVLVALGGALWPADLGLAWESGGGVPADAPLYEVVEVDWEDRP